MPPARNRNDKHMRWQRNYFAFEIALILLERAMIFTKVYELLALEQKFTERFCERTFRPDERTF